MLHRLIIIILTLGSIDTIHGTRHTKLPLDRDSSTPEPTDVPSLIPSSLEIDLVSPTTAKPTSIPSDVPTIIRLEPTSVPTTSKFEGVITPSPTISSSILNTRYNTNPNPKDSKTPEPTNEPSTMPSTSEFNAFSGPDSYVPTNKPTNDPTNQPTNKPTSEPLFTSSEAPTINSSFSPSITRSNQPTIKTSYPSIRPTIMSSSSTSIKPLAMPTSSPTILNPLCQPQASNETNGQFYGAKAPQGMEVSYKYEMEYDPSKSSSASDIVEDLENAITNTLLATFSGCSNTRKRHLRSKDVNQRRLNDGSDGGAVVGLSSSPVDVAIEGETCKSITTALNQCNIMDGKLTLYLSETSNTTFYFQQVVNSLHTGMSDDGELLTANSAIVKLTLLETSNKQILVKETNNDDENTTNDNGLVNNSQRKDPIVNSKKEVIPVYGWITMGSVSFLVLVTGFVIWFRRRSVTKSLGHHALPDDLRFYNNDDDDSNYDTVSF